MARTASESQGNSRTHPRPARSARAALAGLIGVALAALGGCASGGDAEYDALLDENSALRARVSTLQTALDQCEVNRQAAEDENAQLAAGLANMQGGETPGSAATGFEGISGATVTHGSGGEIVVAIAGDVLFDSGRAELKSSAQNSLARIAQVLNAQYAGNTVRIEGYTDSDPIRRSNWQSNEHLSAERALAVERYLVQRGVNNDRVYSAAFGPSNPRATRDQSRRVEIVVLGSGM
ncbi:MAG: OmpA family protein [Phycisphaerales bacterium]|nr:OmpA family protein [Phycisphaerales bacterium]MCB9840026.1 OmpA family protein [Phycisphaeraceae bacterium]